MTDFQIQEVDSPSKTKIQNHKIQACFLNHTARLTLIWPKLISREYQTTLYEFSGKASESEREKVLPSGEQMDVQQEENNQVSKTFCCLHLALGLC